MASKKKAAPTKKTNRTKQEQEIENALNEAGLEYTPADGVHKKVMTFETEDHAKKAIEILRDFGIKFERNDNVVNIKKRKTKKKAAAKEVVISNKPVKPTSKKAVAKKAAVQPVRRKPSKSVSVPQRHIEQLIVSLLPKVRYRVLRNIFKQLPESTQKTFLREMNGGTLITKKAKKLSSRTTDLSRVSKAALEKELAKRWFSKKKK